VIIVELELTIINITIEGGRERHAAQIMPFSILATGNRPDINNSGSFPVFYVGAVRGENTPGHLHQKKTRCVL